MNHYKHLYSAKTTDTVHLEEVIDTDNITILSENEKLSLEENLTYDEMLSSLKKMSNDSSPGLSGFTPAFYKFF